MVGKVSKVMISQRNFAVGRPGRFDPAVALAKTLGQWPKPAPARRNAIADVNAKISVEYLAQELGLTLGDQNELTIRRIKRGKTYSFVRANGTHIRHAGTIRRLNSMAVPRPTKRSVIPPIRIRICRRSAATPPAGCSTAIIPT